MSGLSCRRGKFDKSFVGLLSVGKVYDLEYNVRILESVTLLKFLFDDDSKWFMNNKKQHSDIRKLNAQYKVAMQYLICMLKAKLPRSVCIRVFMNYNNIPVYMHFRFRIKYDAYSYLHIHVLHVIWNILTVSIYTLCLYIFAELCAWNDNYFWPGTCGQDLVKHCQCTSGFQLISTASETSCQCM